MNKKVKKVIIFFLQWILVGGAFLLFLYPKSKAGSIKDVIFHESFKDLNCCSVYLHNDITSESENDRFEFLANDNKEAVKAKEVVDYLSKINIKPIKGFSNSKRLYSITLFDADLNKVCIYVNEDSTLDIYYNTKYRNFKVDDSGITPEGISASLDKVGNSSVSMEDRK